MEILKQRWYILWVDNESPSFPTVFQNDQLPPKCLLLHPPSIQQTGSKREMKGKDITKATLAPCKDKERDGDNLDPPLWRSCRWRGGTERAPSVSYIPLLPQTNPIKLDFSHTAAEHKWQQLWLLFIRGAYGRYDNAHHRQNQSDPRWWRLATGLLQSESQPLRLSSIISKCTMAINPALARCGFNSFCCCSHQAQGPLKDPGRILNWILTIYAIKFPSLQPQSRRLS